MHFERELSKLRKHVLAEAAMVETALERSIRAFAEKDVALARTVIDGDKEIDAMEIEVEEECLKVLALHHPVATDLRFIVTVLKMNNDLERIGDITVSVARRAIYLSECDCKYTMPDEFSEMTTRVRRMLKNALDSLIKRDENLALSTIAEDDDVDALKRQIGDKIREQIRGNPDDSRMLMKMLDSTRHLERIADLATNICEDVVYLIRGKIMRHHLSDVDSA